eukprot:snap_masked-scaffold_85-processed-gene-0.19-mRNA-1 protein AED:1.00 eAED:1.00 QI:0/0/0/0/1/1/2/0/125
MRTLWKFQFALHILILLAAVYFVVITNIVLGSLLKDLKLLSEARINNAQDKGLSLGKETTYSRTFNIQSLIQRTFRTNFILSAYYINGIIFFLCIILIPGAEYSVAYLTPIQLGIAFPILCTLLN